MTIDRHYANSLHIFVESKSIIIDKSLQTVHLFGGQNMGFSPKVKQKKCELNAFLSIC